MATPIKSTPPMSGKDARRFVNQNKNILKVDNSEIDRINKNYKALQSIFKTPL